MDPSSGDLYPTLDDARRAGVTDTVEIRGRVEDIERVAGTLSKAHADNTHECPKDGCTRRIRRNLLACAPHWSLVSQPTQREVYAAYRNRSQDFMRHAEAVQAAIDEMNGHPAQVTG